MLLSPFKELQGAQGIRVQSVGLFLHLPSHPGRGIVCPLPRYFSLSQAEHGFVAWVMCASISPKPNSALHCAESLRGFAGHKGLQRYNCSSQVTVQG